MTKCETLLAHMSVTWLNARHYSLIWVWHDKMRDITRSYDKNARHYSLISHVRQECVTWLMWQNARHYSLIWPYYTGWRRLIGCLKLQVIFRKRATNYRALLRKMTYEDMASYDSTPPWIYSGYMLMLQTWVMSRMRMSHATHTNGSCQTYEWVMLHVWMSHVTQMRESLHMYITRMHVLCLMYECVRSHSWMRLCMRHVTFMNGSCHIYECVMSHLWMRHVTFMNASCHIYECAMCSHVISHHTYKCVMSHMNVIDHT